MTARRVAGRLLRVAFGVAGVAFLAVTFANTWDGSVAEAAVAPWRVAAALALATAGLVCGFRGWATLVGNGDRRALAWGFYYSQLGKYIPGGVWQAVGQVGYTVRAQVSMPRAATAFAVFSLTQAVAGGLAGATLALWPELPALWRLAALAVAGLVVLLHRGLMVRVVAVVRRLRRHDDAEQLVPSQRRILVACCWSLGTIAANAVAFAVLLGGLVPGGVPARTVPAHALAWTVGFLAVPVPSGLAVREAVLIGTLTPSVGTPIVILAAVYHRLVTIGAEGVMILGTRWLGRSRAPASVPPDNRPLSGPERPSG